MAAPSQVARSPDGRRSSGDLIAGKYRVHEELGVGGMGVVYAATNELTRKRVAIKWMLPRFSEDQQSVARFLREARAAGRINHPSVINVFDVGEEHGTPFLVMELLAGTPLSSALARGRLAPATAIEVLMFALRGVAAAHDVGIVHRDLKPDNVFLCVGADRRVTSAKVLDFGISKASSDDEVDKLTRTGAIVGTPHYMSPEQVRGVKNLDARTDVYALGVILYEALTGRLPFEAETFTALAVEIATAVPCAVRELAPAVDPALDTIVMRAIARDRDTRFPDVASLARALEPFGAGARFDDVSSSRPIELALGPIDESAPTVSGPGRTSPGPERAPSVRSIEVTGLSVPVATSELTSGTERATPASQRWLMVAALGALSAAAVGVAAWLGTGSDPVAPTRAEAPPVSAAAPVGSAGHATPAPTAMPVGVEPPPAPAAETRAGVVPPVEPTARAPRHPRAPHATTPALPIEPTEPSEPRSGVARGVRTGGVSADEF